MPTHYPFRPLTPQLWALRIAAIFGCLVLLVCTVATAAFVLPRSWHDLDDANVRMHIFRIHGYDGDFIWSAVGFGTNVVIVVAMFACCLWMFWLLIRHWHTSLGKGGRQP